MKTTSLAGDCVVAKMAKLVEEAQSSKTKSQRLIDKCSQYYTPGKQRHNQNFFMFLIRVILRPLCFLFCFSNHLSISLRCHCPGYNEGPQP